MSWKNEAIKAVGWFSLGFLAMYFIVLLWLNELSDMVYGPIDRTMYPPIHTMQRVEYERRK
jgi:hypothetical protein